MGFQGQGRCRVTSCRHRDLQIKSIMRYAWCDQAISRVNNVTNRLELTLGPDTETCNFDSDYSVVKLLLGLVGFILCLVSRRRVKVG
jgi:hypothetical protein